MAFTSARVTVDRSATSLKGLAGVPNALTTASPSKFLGTKQFTVRGQRTWTGKIPAFATGALTRSGDTKVTWTWEATFRKVKR